MERQHNPANRSSQEIREISQLSYSTFINGQFRSLKLHQAAKGAGREELWSARLGTGILGFIDCPSGRFGPYQQNELIIAVGDQGLEKLVDVGFINCGSCKPADTYNHFWDAIAQKVKDKYNLTSLDEFKKIPYDARRIDWEELWPVIGQFPGRQYLPRGLPQDEVDAFRERLLLIDSNIPIVGYFERSAANVMVEY
ncbi:MAG: hypothetical protein Q8R37_03430 [Nanoarchaeota archaeon]|nr:hypothetical protein [Nanoarchaeota archaeon]